MQTVKIEIFSDFDKLKKTHPFSNIGCVLALGFFDGVHIAHRELIKEAKVKATEQNLPLVIFTFGGDDRSLKPYASRIYSDEEKIFLLEECGVDFVIITKFDVVSNMSKEDFVCDVLVNKINAKIAVCGFNFRFGKGACGVSEDIITLMKGCNRDALIVSEYKVSEHTVSSTYIRELLLKRELVSAAKMLGKPYFITGKVSHGMGLGKKLGIPTINNELASDRFALPNGVYLTKLSIDGHLYSGLTNIGVCPTFNERKTHAETFILGFDGDLYDEIIEIYFIAFLRDEKKFNDANELIMQINIDKKRAFEILEEIEWQEIGLNLQ